MRTLLLAHLLAITSEGWAVVLVKPQFELRGNHDGFAGVVRDDGLRLRVLEEIFEALWEEGAFVHAALQGVLLGCRGPEFDGVRIGRGVQRGPGVAGSAPPTRAATVSSLMSFVNIFPRLRSWAPLRCWILAHLL